jgi:hypothetical protein
MPESVLTYTHTHTHIKTDRQTDTHTHLGPTRINALGKHVIQCLYVPLQTHIHRRKEALVLMYRHI